MKSTQMKIGKNRVDQTITFTWKPFMETIACRTTNDTTTKTGRHKLHGLVKSTENWYLEVMKGTQYGWNHAQSTYSSHRSPSMIDN